MRAPNAELCANDDSCSVALVPIPIPTYSVPRPTPIPDPPGGRFTPRAFTARVNEQQSLAVPKGLMHGVVNIGEALAVAITQV